METVKGEMSAEQVQAIGRALADPRRFAIFKQVAEMSEMTCSQLDVHDCISPATVSHHVRDLQEAGLIGTRREGRGMRMWVERPVWEAYLQRLHEI